MNKHALNYHTRLHDWYRQHSILQDFQNQHNIIPNEAAAKSQPLPSGVGVLTQDKLQFIVEWCTEVNKTLFKVTRSVNAQMYLSSGQWTKRSQNTIQVREMKPQKNSTRHEIKESKTLAKKVPSVQEDDLDYFNLCATNSSHKDASSRSPLQRINHDSLNLRPRVWILKQQGSQVAGKRMNVSCYNRVSSVTKHINQGPSAAVLVKSATSNPTNNPNERRQRHNQLMTGQEINEGNPKAKPWAQSHLEIPSSFREGSEGRWPSCGNAATDRKKQTMPVNSNTRSGISSGEMAPTFMLTVFRKYIHGINTGSEGDNMDMEQRETAHNLSHVRTEQILAKKEKNQPVAKEVDHRQYSFRPGLYKRIRYLPQILENAEDKRNQKLKEVQEQEHPSDHIQIKEWENITNIQKNIHSQDNIMTVHVPTQVDKYHKNDNKFEDHSCCENGQKALISRKFIPDSDQLHNDGQFHSSTWSTEPTIGNISTSNSLLHVMTIDDCKITMRYSWNKVRGKCQTNDSQMMSTELTIPGAVNKARETTSKTSDFSKDNRVASLLPLANDATGDSTDRKLFNEEEMDSLKHKQSAYLTKAFNTLIHDRTILQRLNQNKSTARKADAFVFSVSEGPVYHRIHKVLRRHIEEIISRHGNPQKERYESLKPDSAREKDQKD